MKKLIHLWSALLIGLLVSSCSGKKAPSYLDVENKSALKANRISEYRVTGADEEGVEVTEVFGVRFGEVFSESKHGGKLAVVIPDVSATFNPDPTIWEWRRTDPETQSITFQPPSPNPLFSEYILHYDKRTGRIIGVEGWATNASRQCESLRSQLIEVLDQKYRFKQEFSTQADGSVMGITEDEIEIAIGCDQLRLLYFDLKPVVHQIEIDASTL
ncbi:MAG: hypothetical protein ACPGCN_15615 [bacterium]